MRFCQLAWGHEISKKLMEQNQKFFGAFLSMKSWKTVVSKEWQGKPIPHSVLHCLLGYIYALFKHHMFSQVSAVAKHHMPPFQVASRKTPCLCSQPNILPCVRFSKNMIAPPSYDTADSPKKLEHFTLCPPFCLKKKYLFKNNINLYLIETIIRTIKLELYKTP